MRLARLLLGTLLVAVTFGCGSPAAPYTPPARDVFQPGDYTMLVGATSFPPPCNTTLASQLISSRVSVTAEGADFVARSRTAADGDIVIRFRDSGGAILDGFTAMSGTIAGTALDVSNSSTLTRAASIAPLSSPVTVDARFRLLPTMLWLLEKRLVTTFSDTKSGATASCPLESTINLVK